MHAVRRYMVILILGSIALMLLLIAVKDHHKIAFIGKVQQHRNRVAGQNTNAIRADQRMIRLVADVGERASYSPKLRTTQGGTTTVERTYTAKSDEVPYKNVEPRSSDKASREGLHISGSHNTTQPGYNTNGETTHAHAENGPQRDNGRKYDAIAGARSRSDLPTCTPRKNLLFLKTHKTGSSTIQNIVYRYGDSNGLTFALPKSGVYMGAPSLFKSSFAIRSPTGRYNMLANHARYNRPEMTKIMNPDAAYITIMRHPSTQFESMYEFYGFKSTFKVNLAGFADNPLQYYPRQSLTPAHSALNPTLYDLGMAKRDFNDEGALRRKITALEEEFDLILVSEFILESLVLLKDLMCWDLSDVTFFSANARAKSKVHEISGRTFDQLYKWNRGDALLYEQANRTLWRKVEEYGWDKMSRDVKALEKMNEELADKCLGGTKTELSVATKVSRYVLKPSMKNDPQCTKMIRPAIQYLEALKKKQTWSFLKQRS